MKKQYNIFYKDGVHYGTMTFTNKSQSEIEDFIKEEIKENNKTVNPLFHLDRSGFVEVV